MRATLNIKMQRPKSCGEVDIYTKSEFPKPEESPKFEGFKAGKSGDQNKGKGMNGKGMEKKNSFEFIPLPFIPLPLISGFIVSGAA
jgi:hypothetical protein